MARSATRRPTTRAPGARPARPAWPPAWSRPARTSAPPAAPWADVESAHLVRRRGPSRRVLYAGEGRVGASCTPETAESAHLVRGRGPSRRILYGRGLSGAGRPGLGS